MHLPNLHLPRMEENKSPILSMSCLASYLILTFHFIKWKALGSILVLNSNSK